ncbi:hypothetical protein DKX38_006516 [Salix brachista]|uniref:Phytosulfokine n=2 Tax=Salix TaxID=40685 RepID=A0A5N5N2J3_9ROSI|nr:hypothetical protein DKX38_006516 [Salix brachista]
MAVEKEDSATEAIGAVASTILVVLHVGAISVCMESMLLLLYDIFTHSSLDFARTTMADSGRSFSLFDPNNGVSTQHGVQFIKGSRPHKVRNLKGKTMKQNLHYKALLLFLLVLVHSSKLSARFLLAKQGRDDLNLKEITSEGTPAQTDDSELITNQLMGLELCQSGDDECFKRRIIAEAHLDYIYTQHRKP